MRIVEAVGMLSSVLAVAAALTAAARELRYRRHVKEIQAQATTELDRLRREGLV